MSSTDNNLERIFCPKTIAVFGGHFAEAVIKQCDKMGFAGEIWPVHPKREQLSGRVCYASVEQLPGSPDVSFIGVNRQQTISIVAQLSKRQAGGAVCYASGFSETGDHNLTEDLLDAAGDMPVLGPNCYGFINYLDGALLWPDQHGGGRVDRGVAIVMQSSNVAINLTMNTRALPIAYMVTLGNQARVGLSEVVSQLCQDDRVSAIGLHIEGLDDVVKFSQAIALAHQHGKAVVVIKTGASEKGAAITMSHTASLSSNDQVMSALFERLGVARVDSLEAFIESLKLLHVHGALTSNQLISLSCSGGEASLISDAAQNYPVQFTDFTEHETASIRSTVHELVTISNPFDYHTFDWANHDRLLATFSAVMQSQAALKMLLLDYPRADKCDGADWDVTLKAWRAAAQLTKAKTAVIASLPENLPEPVAQSLLADGVVPLCGFDHALAAAAAAAKIDLDRSQHFKPIACDRLSFQTTQNLDEYTAKQQLAGFGVQCAVSAVCDSADAAADFADSIGYPVVVKAIGAQLLHKTEIGGVKLNLIDAQAVREATTELSGLSPSVLVEQMICDVAVEFIVGVNRDPVVGLYLVLGAGGVYTELLSDTTIMLFPFTEADVICAIQDLRIFKLMNGYRGKAKIELSGLVETIMAAQRYAMANQQTLLELDINPLMVCSDGQALAADAVIRYGSN